MTITPTTLFRAAGVAASVAGLIFIGVQINHPHLDATSITTTDVIARNLLKMLMAALALAGITGMYLRQVTKIGVLGLLGYVLFPIPTGLALVGLGYSLWRQQRTPAAPSTLNSVSLQLDAIGAK